MEVSLVRPETKSVKKTESQQEIKATVTQDELQCASKVIAEIKKETELLTALSQAPVCPTVPLVDVSASRRSIDRVNNVAISQAVSRDQDKQKLNVISTPSELDSESKQNVEQVVTQAEAGAQLAPSVPPLVATLRPTAPVPTPVTYPRLTPGLPQDEQVGALLSAEANNLDIQGNQKEMERVEKDLRNLSSDMEGKLLPSEEVYIYIYIYIYICVCIHSHSMQFTSRISYRSLFILF